MSIEEKSPKKIARSEMEKKTFTSDRFEIALWLRLLFSRKKALRVCRRVAWLERRWLV